MSEIMNFYNSELERISMESKENIKKIESSNEDKFMELLIELIKVSYEIDFLNIYIKELNIKLDKYNNLKKEYLFKSTITKKDIKKAIENNILEISSAIALLYSCSLFITNNPSDYGLSLLKMSLAIFLSYKIVSDYLTSDKQKNKAKKKELYIDDCINNTKYLLYFYEGLKRIYERESITLDRKTKELEPPKLDNETEEEYNNRILSMYQETRNIGNAKTKRRIKNDR